MGADDSCRSPHLTELQIEGLLSEHADNEHLTNETMQHLERCQSCQLLLETSASRPEDWDRFSTVMEGLTKDQNGEHRSRQQLEDRRFVALEKISIYWPAIAITGLAAALVLVALLKLPEVVSIFDAPEPSGPASAPPAPPSPGGAPAAPAPES